MRFIISRRLRGCATRHKDPVNGPLPRPRDAANHEILSARVNLVSSVLLYTSLSTCSENASSLARKRLLSETTRSLSSWRRTVRSRIRYSALIYSNTNVYRCFRWIRKHHRSKFGVLVLGERAPLRFLVAKRKNSRDSVTFRPGGEKLHRGLFAPRSAAAAAAAAADVSQVSVSVPRKRMF